MDQMVRGIYNGTKRLQWTEICYS